MRNVRVGVLDIGSNTIRLLVARVERGEVVALDKEKVRLSLGDEIERYGSVSAMHIAAAANAVRKLCKTARECGVESLDVFLTAPGRQSENAAELVAALRRAAGVPVRVLSTEEEGSLAYAGAVATASISLPSRIAVCDVGGASTEVAVGSPEGAPDWVASVALGSVRLTARVLDGGRVGSSDLERARVETEEAFAGVTPPVVETALAVGGSARAARRLVGSELSADALAEALSLVAENRPRTISRRYGVDPARAQILPAGVVLLAEVQRRLDVPLHVCDGGIREGSVLASVEALAAA
jgi:exopolyphosphatase / guanosine-5'-triphosphate,3'-diphosphate pyrophosphatase